MSTGKAAGPDEINAEMLKDLHEEGIWELIDKIYKTGVMRKIC